MDLTNLGAAGGWKTGLEKSRFLGSFKKLINPIVTFLL